MKNDIVVSTISWIRTPEESRVVLKTIELLTKLETPIIVVDKGSSPPDLERIKSFKNVVLFVSKLGLTEQLLRSHKEAEKLGEYVFYLHTDKYDFARDTAPKLIEKYRSLVKKGILIPTRTEESLNTYPIFQRKVEDYLNFFMGDYIGVEADYYAGPKIYPSSLVKYLDKLKGDVGWGIEAYFYAIAKRLNLSFDFFPFYMQSPVDIEDQEKTKQYRLRIMQWQIEGMIQGQALQLK